MSRTMVKLRTAQECYHYARLRPFIQLARDDKVRPSVSRSHMLLLDVEVISLLVVVLIAWYPVRHKQLTDRSVLCVVAVCT